MKTSSEKFKSNGEAPPMFENKILNRLTQTHIATPIVIFLVYAVALLWYTVTRTEVLAFAVVGLFLLGTLTFTLAEYIVHRWVYHPPHGSSDKYKEMTYNMHGFHHDYPKDKKRLAMPPVLAMVISTVLLFLFELVLQQYAFAYLAGFVVGYALYLVVHYTVHMYPPPKNFLKTLWINHALHHYSKDEILFGVSQPLWDYVFRTMPKSKRDKHQAVEVVR
jgi:sterol desaturase/sphingolipid hydroxylase (fatty acid hydroxylase superfamily)